VKDIDEGLKKAIYDHLKDHQPELIDAIRDRLTRGFTPLQIEKMVKSLPVRFPTTAFHVYCVASYLKKLKK